MCKDIRIWKQDDDKCMFSDLGEVVIVDTPVLCTCWLGAEPTGEIDKQELDQLHTWFMGKLKPFLADPRVGDIIIEVV